MLWIIVLSAEVLGRRSVMVVLRLVEADAGGSSERSVALGKQVWAAWTEAHDRNGRQSVPSHYQIARHDTHHIEN